MSRYRSTRPDPRSKLTAPFLRRMAELPEKREAGRFPFTLPFMRRGGFALELTNPITFFVGENGTGKSSLLEAIARNAGFNARGGSRDNYYGGDSDESGLAAALTLSWLPKVGKGFFFRAESFFNFIPYVEQAYREDPFSGAPPWGERSLNERSHGEAFLSFFQARLGSHERCLYLLDEPEAALSPERQLEFMAMLEEQRATGKVQYIIATHSPLLMAFPGADLLHFSYRGLRHTTLELTPHFRIYRDFCREPQAFLEAQLARIAAERAEALSAIDEAAERGSADPETGNGEEDR
jgi:predicted ATPase